MRDNDMIAILSLLTLILFVLAFGFNEIFNRLRPRVIYVYGDSNEPATNDIPIWGGKRDPPVDDSVRSRDGAA